MIVVAFHSELESYYLQEAPLLHKEVEDVLAEISRRQSEGNPTENIPSSSRSPLSLTQKDENHSRNAVGNSSNSDNSSNMDNGNVLSSQSNPSPSPSPRRDHDIPF